MAATHAFRAEKTRPETHAAVAQLLDLAQVNPNMVYQNLFEKKPLADLYLLRLLAPKARLHYNDQAVSLSVPRHEVKAQGYTRNDLHRVLDYPFISKQVKAIFLFTESERQDYTRVMMLSKAPFNAYELLDEWNPLGDKARAEAVLPAPRQEAEAIILERFAHQLKPKQEGPANG
jgi:nanoRNase/pAp phosphatase (c-di-AMP/oligoRNAs hydrolase)